MKKTKGVFLKIMMVELIIAVVSYFIKVSYPTPCDAPNFLKPFGSNYEVCVQVVSYAPSRIFFISVDLLILTIAVYAIYHIFRRDRE